MATALHRSRFRQYVRARQSVGRPSIVVSISTSRQGRTSSVRPIAKKVMPVGLEERPRRLSCAEPSGAREEQLGNL